LPNANIGITAIDTAKWTVTVTPTSNAHGTVTLRLTASDGSASSSRDILLTIVDVNDPPTISAIANQSTNEDVPITGIGFVVGDVETSAENLIITVSSDNSTLLPSSSFVLGGTGTNRTLSITPAEDRYGTAGVFITVDDGTDKVVRTFTVTVNPVPDAPRLKGLADTTIKEDEVLKLPVTVHSPDYPLSSVSISFSSDNQTLVADSAIQLIGTGSSRTLVITPTAEWSGRAVITAVSTADGLTSQQSFALTVEPVNDEPFVTEIPDQEILEGGTTPVLGFTIGDIETPAANLTVSATSSDTAIVPNGNIVLGGSGPIRTIQVTPAPDRFGTVTITVSVSDGEAVGTKSFQVVIENINDAPSFTAGPDVTVNEDAGPQSMPGWATGVTAGPFETAQKLTFTTSVDNPSLFAVEPKVSVGGTLTFTTALHAYGTATVSVQLTDDGSTTNGGVDSSGIQTFVITVTPVNDLPVISEIPNQGTEESMRTERLLFTVSDVESAEASIQVTARSSNQDLVPDENITLGGENGDRWVQIQPVPGWIGTTTITLRASDGEGFSEFSFPLIVNNLKLSALVPSVGQLTPAFNPNTLSYNAFYNGTVTEATLTPAAMDPDVQIWVNGTRVTSNRPSAPQQLTDRGGDVLVVVRAPATGLEKSYSVRFVRELSKDANLVDLSITPGKLAPEFDPEVTSYKATVDPTATDVAVDARPADGRAKVKVTGNTGLQTGTSFIQIEVVAENGERKLYTIEVTRESPQLTFSGDVKVEAGSEWTTLAFGTSDPAKATVHYQTVTGKQETVPSSGGVSHTVSLGPLIPGTTYTYSIVASRSDGSTAHYTSFFTTADTPPSNVCPGGEIRPDGPRTVLVRCPGDEKSTAAAKLAMADTAPTADVTATPVTQLVMGEALKQAGVKGLTEAPATVVVRAEASGKVQSAVVEHAAIQQALRVGASLEVRFNQGSLTLPPTALADLMRENPARLVVLLGEVSPERDDLKPWLEKPFRRISSVVDVSVATLFNDGRVVHHDTFAVPLRLTLNTAAIPQESRKLAGVFWLKEDLTGKASQRLYQGGSVDLERSTISVETGHLSSYVALLFDAQFADVPKSHWAHDVVHQMAARQVVDWPANDLFDPEIPVTRGEVASLLVRALGLETDERFAYVYRDIKVGDPLAGEIGGAIMAGLMMGYPDATFHPEARITRQELAVVLHRVSNRYSRLGIMAMPKTSVQASAYRDWNEVAAWAKDAVQSAMAQGLMTGRAKDTFSPGGITTRAEAVTVVKRLLDWIEGSKEP
ncbi:MAG: S-layer homology domain-containing protein, partial [Bacillota bacterium]